MKRRTGLTIVATLTLLVLAGSAAYAYWTATSAPGSSGASQAGVMPTGTTPSTMLAGSNPHDVSLAWAPTLLSSGDPVGGYEILRYEAGDPDEAEEACDGTVEHDSEADPEDPVECLDEDVPTGAWVYTVTPVLNDWVGTEGDESGTVTVGGASLVIDPPTLVGDLPATLEGEVAGFFDMEEIEFAIGSETGDELDGTVDELDSPAAVKANGSADVTINLPEDVEQGAQTIYAVGDGYTITHEDLSEEDVPGNVASAGIVVDTVAPTAPTLTLTPTNPTTATTADFAFENGGLESVSFECALDGDTEDDFEPCTSPTTYGSIAEPLTPGSHTFEVRAIDGAGNESTVTTFTWVINAPGGGAAPDVTITFPADGSSYNALSYTAGCAPLIDDICGTATDNGSSGLDKVEVSVRQGTGNYWDGDGFDSAGEVLLPASGESSWTLGFSGSNFTPDGSYTVRALVTANDLTTGTDTNTFTIDTAAPQVTSINRADPSPTNQSLVDYTVTFTEPVANVDSGDFVLTTSGVSGASITSVTGTGATRNVEINTGTGDGTVRLDLVDDNSIVDGAGNILVGNLNANGSFNGETYQVEKVAPHVQSIDRAGASPTNEGSVDFTVTFNKAVTGVDATDFTVPMTGSTTGASVSNVAGSGATRTISVNTGTGSGTVGLNLTDDGTILDQGGNALKAQNGDEDGSFVGQTYAVDKTAPTVLSSNRSVPPGQTTSASSVQFELTFSESVTGVDATDFVTTNTGTLTGTSVTNVSGTGATRTVTVDTGTGEGDLRLDVNDDDTILDGAGNKLGGTNPDNGDFTGGQVYTINRAPFVVSINRANPSPTNAATVNFTVTFSENVTGVGVADFDLNPASFAGASITGVSGASPGSVYTVSVSTGTPTSGTLGLDLDDDDTIIDSVGNPLVQTPPGTSTNGDFTGESYTIDKVAPVGTPSTQNVGNNDGQIQSTDRAIITFTETMNVSTFCSSWNGNTTNQSLSNGTITISNNNSGAPNNHDTLTASAPVGTCVGGFRFGQLNLGNNGFITSATPVTFSNSTFAWNATTNQLTLTFGTICGGCSTGDVNASSVVTTYVPPVSPATLITDVVGNTATGANSAAARQF